MRKNNLVRTVFLILLLSAVLLSAVGCHRASKYILPDNSEINVESDNDDLTDKSKFIGKINADFNISENSETTEFTAEPFAQMADLSAVFSVDFKISENSIYIGDTLYESVKVISSPEISYNNALLASANKSVTNDEVFATVQKMQSCEACYMLETESTTAKAKKIAVYVIDGDYYFVSFSNSNEISRIHYVNR